jgi:hypothetical protein
MTDEKPHQKRLEPALGAAVAIGAGIGTALFAATGSPVWIGVGVAIGAGVGVALSQNGTDEGGDG